MSKQIWTPPETKLSLGRRFANWSRRQTYKTRLFNRYLKSVPPMKLNGFCRNRWPGDADRGNAIFQGRYRFADHEEIMPNQPPWDLAPEQVRWTRALHRFNWLADIDAVKTDSAKLLAQRMVLSWIEQNRNFDAVTWAPDVVGQRLLNWLRHGKLLLQGLEPRHRDRILASIQGQLRYLRAAGQMAKPGRQRLTVAMALVTGGVEVPGNEKILYLGGKALARELAAQFPPEGGYFQRDPKTQFAVARDLVALLGDLRRAAHPLTDQVAQQVERVMSVIQLLRHGDGGLADFGGACGSRLAEIDLAVGLSGSPYRNGNIAAVGGYQRLSADHSLAIIDTGRSPIEANGDGYADVLSFELSIGPNRLVINGVEVEEENGPASSCFTVAGRGVNGSAGKIKCRRHEDEADSVWLEAVHGGFQGNFGVLHQRRFFLDGDGSNLRGEDVLLRANDAFADGRPCAAYFHLHPDVQASQLQDGQTILLRLNSGGGWQFRCDGGELDLCEVSYRTRAGHVRRTKSIKLEGKTAADGTKLRWVFHRM